MDGRIVQVIYEACRKTVLEMDLISMELLRILEDYGRRKDEILTTYGLDSKESA